MIARLLVVLAVLPRALAAVRTPRAPAANGAGRTPRAAAPAVGDGEVAGDDVPPVAGGVRIARRVLVALGAVLVGIGLGTLIAGVPLGQWPAIGVWLAVALVLHDGLLAPLLIVGARLLRRGSDRLPWGSLALVQGAVVVGGAVTLLAIPAIRAQQIGARNPSVLVFDYGAHLAAAWAVVGAVVAAAIVVGAVRRSRAR